jgi:hypothetical protein
MVISAGEKIRLARWKIVRQHRQMRFAVQDEDDRAIQMAATTPASVGEPAGQDAAQQMIESLAQRGVPAAIAIVRKPAPSQTHWTKEIAIRIRPKLIIMFGTTPAMNKPAIRHYPRPRRRRRCRWAVPAQRWSRRDDVVAMNGGL